MTTKTCGCSAESCGCCEGTQALTPEPVWNRPGLSALAARVGTHGTFFETMKARLASFQPLRSLTTRDPGDPAVALLDGWATIGDVLSFYQERIANEGYLRTATERRSVLELARLVGYAPRPGVASTVFLAYTLEDKQTDPVEIPIGARSQSIPGPGESPQTFETTEKLVARSDWNNLKPRMTQPQQIALLPLPSAQSATSPVPAPPVPAATSPTAATAVSPPPLPPPSATTTDVNTDTIYFQGTATNLKPNDPLLFAHSDGKTQVLRYVFSVEADFTKSWTKVILQGAKTDPQAQQKSRGASSDFDHLIGPLARPPSIPPRNSAALKRDTSTALAANRDALPQLVAAFKPEISADLYKAWANAAVMDPPSVSVHTFRVQATPFGSNAPLRPITDSKGKVVGHDEWPLSGAATIRIEFETMARPVTVLFAHGKQTSQVTLPSGRTGRFALGSSETCNFIKVTDEMSYSFEFRGIVESKIVITAKIDDIGGSTVAFSTRGAQGNLVIGVKIGNSAEVNVRRGQTLHYSVNEQQMALSLSEDVELTVEVISPLPTDAKNILYMDTLYPLIVAKTWVVIIRGNAMKPEVTHVKSVQSISKADYGITGKSTQLTLVEDWLTKDDIDLSSLRETTVFAQSEELRVAEKPYENKDPKTRHAVGSPSDVLGAEIELEDLYDGLKSGRWIIVSGERSDIKTGVNDKSGNPIAGVRASELVMLAGVEQGYDPALPGDQVHSTLILTNALEFTYKRSTVTIYGNVAKATNGETRNETLGGGDGSKPLQTFSLKQPPITFVPAPSVSGVESTLKVYVNNVEWHEVDTLAGLGPRDRKFVTKTDDDGKTTVIFGNGDEGSRLPTGVENVKAVYRNGLGKGGNVQAEQISMLMTRPLGVKGVINPLRASGGADKERSDQIRENAPMPVMALERLVSLQDYADFTRTFAGIAKADARHLSDGKRELVHLTIAGADDIPIDTNSELYANLLGGLQTFGDPDLPVRVELRELLVLVLSANVQLNSDYLWEPVSAAIRNMLLATFGFQKRALGQPVWLSEVVSKIQNIEGVAYVDVDTFGGLPEKISDNDDKSNKKLTGNRRLLTLAEMADEVQKLSARREPAQRVNVNLADFHQSSFQPAQLAIFIPTVPATLILNQIK